MQYIMPKRKSAELKEVADNSPKVPSRSEIKRAVEENFSAFDSSSVLNKLNETIGITDTTNVVSATPAQIDILASELLAVRDAKDVVDGREASLKRYATEIINNRIFASGENPDEKSGFLVSPDNGIKISKEVTGGKLEVNVELLRQNLSAEQFKSVTNKVTIYKTIEYADGTTEVVNETIYELNEDRLEDELANANIGMEQVIKSATPGKVRTAVYVRKL